MVRVYLVLPLNYVVAMVTVSVYRSCCDSSLKTEDNVKVVKSLPLDRILIETGRYTFVGYCHAPLWLNNSWLLGQIQDIANGGSRLYYRGGEISQSGRVRPFLLTGGEGISLPHDGNLRI